jgi:hypothetical protein
MWEAEQIKEGKKGRMQQEEKVELNSTVDQAS